MTNLIKFVLIVLLLNASAATATPASDNSIKELLAITEAKSLVNGMVAQMDSSMTKSINDSLRDKTPNPKQQEAINTMKSKMLVIMQSALAWENLEPIYIQIYKESLTEEEIMGIVAFYKTPAGQAMIKKMPLVMQKLIPQMQKMSAAIAPEMQLIQQEFIADMKYAEQAVEE